MSANTPDVAPDNAGVRAVLNARANEVFMHAGITGDPTTRAAAERLRAAANGDISVARAELDRARAQDEEADHE